MSAVPEMEIMYFSVMGTVVNTDIYKIYIVKLPLFIDTLISP